MTPQQLEQQLKDALITAANVQQRDYLGMSSIGQCPRKIFFELVEGKPDDDRLAWYSYAGYMHEHSLIRLMGFEPPAQQIEVVAAFDSRFRGHVDYVLADDTLIECKSVDCSNFTKLYGGPKAEHVDQVQMYLRHGGWPRALIVYTARDITPSTKPRSRLNQTKMTITTISTKTTTITTTMTNSNCQILTVEGSPNA